MRLIVINRLTALILIYFLNVIYSAKLQCHMILQKSYADFVVNKHLKTVVLLNSFVKDFF